MRRGVTLKHLLTREEGAIAPLSAVMMVLLLAMTGLVTDSGAWYIEKRRLQSALDSAVLSALMREEADPHAATVSAILSANSFESFDDLVVTSGTYCPDAGVSAASRFYTSGSCANPAIVGTNAVRASAAIPSSLFLSAILLDPGTEAQVAATSTAARIDEAGFAAGTGLLELDGGVANALLGSLLGTNVTLTLTHYEGLLQTDVDALDFLEALALEAGVTAGTYGQLLDSSVTMAALLDASIAALQASGEVAGVALDAMDGLLALQSQLSGAPTVTVGDLIGLGVWDTTPIGGSGGMAALDAGLNLYQLVMLAAQAANGGSFLAVPSLAISVPGVATIGVSAIAVEPVQEPYINFGPVGATIHTAQVRLQLEVTLLNVTGVNGIVNLPLYLEVAGGDAELTGITCGDEPEDDTSVEVTAQSGAVGAWIGRVNPPSAITNFTQPVTVQPARLVDVTLLGLPVLRINASAQASVSGKSAALTFSRAEIEADTTKTIDANGAIVSSLLGSLGSNLTLTPVVLGLGGNGLISGVLSSLTGALLPVLGALDPVLEALLSALGLRLGTMDVTATGVRCGLPVLVN